jgi:cysteine-rich repeat protein
MFCLRNRCRVAALVLIVAGGCSLPSQVVAEPAGPTAPLEALTELEQMQLASPLAAPVAAASALSSLPIVASFPSPGDRPRGLEHDGTYLYVAQASIDDYIFKVDPATGATVDTYPWTVTFFPIGIAWDGTYFYVSDDTAENIYVVDTGFNYLWALPRPETWQRDLAFDGTHLLEATVYTDKVWTLETAHGNVIDSFDAPDDRGSGLAWDGTHIWLCDTLQNVIYKLDTDGNILEQYQAPGSYPTGLAFHEDYLWLVDWETDTIYKLGPYTPDLTPPDPDPMTWDSLPTATGGDSIEMTATTAVDAANPPVEYFFECTTDAGASSGWQADPYYEATGLTASTLYTFRVKARDSTAAQNETGWSSSGAATTSDTVIYDLADITSPSATHTAEDGEIDIFDTVIENGLFSARRGTDLTGWNYWNEASSADYAALVGSDDSHYQGADSGYGDNAAMLFTFYVAEDPADILQLDVSVELGRSAETDFGWVYVWDYDTSSYLVLGSQSGTADQVIAATIDTNPGHYVETGTGQLTIFVVNEDDSDWIRVDDISVAIQSAVPAVCGNTLLESGEDCDDGNTAPGDCCSPTCQYEPDTTTCRASVGACDIAELCDGDGNCPTDAVEPPTTVCRAAAGTCDAVDYCDGASAACTPDAKLTSQCRASAGVCDVVESCDGIVNHCPADGFEPSTTECRDAAGTCDVAEMCPGTAASCPGDEVLDGVPCPDSDVCNGDEMCEVGICVSGDSLDCSDGDPCTSDGCDAITGCENTPIVPCTATPTLGSWGQALLIALLTAAGAVVGIVQRRSFR